MIFNRRNFLRKAGLFAATPLLINELASCTPASKSEEKKSDSTATAKLASEPSLKEFGIQLWTVKEDMAKDAKGVLKALADYGYNFIESFSHEGPKIFWDMKPKDFKAYIDSIGLNMYSAHCDPAYTFDAKKADEFKRLADDAASIGMKYLINPYMGNKAKTLDDFKKATEGLNRCGEIANKVGLKYGYHNHHYSFQKIGGEFPQDVMMQGTDANLVDFELDLYWVKAAGQDPIEWIKKYPNRFKLCHVKDIYSEEKIKDIQSKEKVNPDFPVNASCDVGTGAMEFSKILKVAADNGMQHYIVEQERFDNSTQMKSAQADAAYMKKLIFA
jgi:sugar phosphate isomerase/epimerase